MRSDVGNINGSTKLLGLLATPIGHSLSPAMHNMSLRKLGLNYAYMAFEVGNEQLADVVTGLRALNVRGFNVSMPNKTKILPLLDELSPAARFAGAVNTVVNESGKLIGHNTDGIGYMQSLKEANVNMIGKKMTLIGAGGAATAIAIQAALDGVAEIAIFNGQDEFYDRALHNACIIKEEMPGVHCKVAVHPLEDSALLQAEIASSQLLTNATGIGMKPYEDQSVIPSQLRLQSSLVVSDIIYIPRETKLLKMAKEAGCQTMNGLGMMLYQGAKAFELWTGNEMPVEYVKNQLFQ